MGTWLHGWVEERYSFVEDGRWNPLVRTGRFLGYKAWWRVPLFGYDRLLEGFFEPVPFESGVPPDLSETVRFDVAGLDDGGLADPTDRFFRPEEDAMYATYDVLRDVDWTEPRADLREIAPSTPEVTEDSVAEFDSPSLERYYRFELRDASGTVLDTSPDDLTREEKLAAVARTAEGDPAFVRRIRAELPDDRLDRPVELDVELGDEEGAEGASGEADGNGGDGPVDPERGTLHAVRRTRGDYLPRGGGRR